jgi:hypothetical protein
VVGIHASKVGVDNVDASESQYQKELNLVEPAHVTGLFQISQNAT